MTVEPQDAATVIMLREGPPGQRDQGFDVLMVLRSSRNAFVPGSHVFPGGRVDPEDGGGAMRSRIYPAADFTAAAQTDGDGVALRVAAIRETFEEVGILLATPVESSQPVSYEDVRIRERYRACRGELLAHRVSFQEFLEREHLVPSLDRLHYYSRWITPVQSPLRYDARFFVTVAPPCQEALHDGNEIAGHLWISPRDALARYRNGGFHMVLPTIVTLEELSRFHSVNDVIASTADKNIQACLTRLVFEGGEPCEVAPDGRLFRTRAPRG